MPGAKVKRPRQYKNLQKRGLGKAVAKKIAGPKKPRGK